MKTEMFVKTTRLEAPAAEVFRWHERPGALERLVPPWERVQVIDRTGGIENGSRVTLRGPGGRWIVEHRDVVPGAQFRDVLLRGPFPRWEHTHRMNPEGEGACLLEDRIEYALPLGLLGSAVAGAYVRSSLERLFDYRHRRTARDLQEHRGGRPRSVLVSGATGLVGSELLPLLSTGGHQVRRLGRGPGGWDPEGGRLDPGLLEGLDGVVHLAGENIANGRWTPDRKARIRESRVRGTRLLCETLARLKRPPETLVSASAVGFYGDRGEEELTESSRPGFGYLAEVCKDWEQATEPARDAGIRVVNLRLGIVLSPKGGALSKMLLPFSLGLGGRLGHGRQFMSWISLSDLSSLILRALTDSALSGPVNAVAPHPVTNREFTRTLASVLGRPAFTPMPAFLARLAFGEMAEALLLGGAKVLPGRLTGSGFEFQHPTLEIALRELLGRPKK
jgi:uncharacterized protein (TIGR01777 family)